MPAETFAPQVEAPRHKRKNALQKRLGREASHGRHERLDVRKSGRRKIGAGIMRLMDRMHATGLSSSRHVNKGDMPAPEKPMAHSEDLAGLRRQLETFRIPERPVAPAQPAVETQGQGTALPFEASPGYAQQQPGGVYDDPEIAALHNREPVATRGEVPAWATERQEWHPAVQPAETVADQVGDVFAEDFLTSDEPDTGRHHLNPMFTPMSGRSAADSLYQGRHAVPDQAPDARTDPEAFLKYTNNPMKWVNLRRGK